MKKKTREEFIKQAISIHGDRYNYDDIVYINNQTKVKLKCKTHGDFFILPREHLRTCKNTPEATKGCRKCFTKKKKINMQNKFKNKKFGYDQYWKMYYEVVNLDKSETKYISVIKARSLMFAKRILEEKFNEDSDCSQIKSIQGFMFHSSFLQKDGARLSIEDWYNIRNCSFPNENNYLFKYKINHLLAEQAFKKNQEKLKNLV